MLLVSMPLLFLAAIHLPTRCGLRLHLHLPYAVAAVTTPGSHFVVEDYLIANCYLTQPQALKASKNLTHLKSPSNPDAILAGLGLSPKEVDAAAAASNLRILCACIDRSLAPISAELRALGLSLSQIARLAKMAGRYFLCRSFVSKVRF